MKQSLLLIGAMSSAAYLSAGTDPVLYFQEQSSSFVAQDDETTSNTDVAQPSSGNSYYYKFPDAKHNCYGGVNYLYWTVSEPGLYYATTKDFQLAGEEPITVDNTIETYELGTVQQASFDWRSGGRGFIGYQFDHTPWALYGEYTYFSSSGKQTVNRPDSLYGYLAGSSMVQVTDTPAAQAKSSISFQYQTTRILLEAAWHPLPEVMTTFGFGPKASWYKQYWTVRFLPFTSNFGSIDAATGTTTLNQYKNKAWGVGLNVASDVDFNLGCGFSLGVGGSLSPLVGQVYLRNQATKAGVGSSSVGVPPLEQYVVQKYTYRFIWEGQIATTLAWSYNTPWASTRVSLGYEFNSIWNINDQYRPGGTVSFAESAKFPNFQNEPIYLHGLVAGFSVGF